MIQLQDITKVYPMGKRELTVLRGITTHIQKGELVAIMGPSGSGKTTMLNLLGCLDIPTAGSYYLEDREVSRLKSSELAQIRGEKIGFIFQTFNLIQVLTALENVALPTVFAGTSHDEGIKKAGKLLESVGLKTRTHHRPSELSAGQQQRVAIARALANDPAIILADEPTGNLDLQTGQEIIDLLHGLNKTQGLTLVAATHDLKMIKASDRNVWMRDGKIERIERG